MGTGQHADNSIWLESSRGRKRKTAGWVVKIFVISSKLELEISEWEYEQIFLNFTLSQHTRKFPFRAFFSFPRGIEREDEVDTK